MAYRIILIVLLCAIASCAEPASIAPAASPEVQSETIAKPAEKTVDETTGDTLLDQTIAWLRSSGDEYQTKLRSFETVSAAFAMLPLEPSDDGQPFPEDTVEWARSIVINQSDPDVRGRIEKAGSARLLLLEECGAHTGPALGVPESYFPENIDSYDLLDRARLISATRDAGIGGFDASAFSRYTDDDTGEHMRQLNRMLAQAQGNDGLPPLLVLDMSEGCGAGEVLVRIRTDPPASSLRLIPAFFFSLCEKQGFDPWSPDDCRWWVDALDDEGKELVAGAYYYQAHTDGGRVRKGKFGVTDAELSNESETSFLIKL